MKKLRLQKAEKLQNVHAFQPLLLWDRDTTEKEACAHKAYHILSDTPNETTPEDYPYQVVDDGVILHPIFNSLFTMADIVKMSKQEADRLFATEVGFDKRSGHACRIFRDGAKIKIMVYPPNEEPYIMDCFTGLKKEEK